MTKYIRRALLLIDFQRDFLADDGRMPVAREHVTPVVRAAREAIDTARLNGDLIVAIGNEFRASDWLMNLLRHHAAIAGSRGAQWDERIDIDGLPYLPKRASSAFSNPQLEKLLDEQRIGTVVLAGLFARACVTATANAAVAGGFKVIVLANAIACASDKSRDRALARLRRKGIVVNGEPLEHRFGAEV